MVRLLRNYLDEFKKIDLEAATIIIYSTLVLLFVLFLRRTHFILPGEAFLERLIIVGLIYVISPLLLLFLFKRTPKDFGINLGNPKQWMKEVFFFYAIFLIILIIAFKFTNLKTVYPLYRKAAHGMSYFFFYQLIQLWYMLGWEFFFRGFMLFGLERTFGRMSIVIQAMPFALWHFKKPKIEAYGAIFAGIFLGIIGLRARSFLPCVLLHYLIIVTADILGLIL
ncbi:CPBP family intramembrane metalloprotease [candidate division WOR-3 bacterium]|nr:CPBP family intramembrane metalloprotease [candidate division WOR-3 bacterium]